MSFIRTVLGDLAPAELGVCYAHEHVIIDAGYVTEKNPDFRLDSVAKAVAELREFRACGGRAMVDSMPGGCGRNASKMAEVSRQAGVHLIVPTGIHLAQYYPPDDWIQLCSGDEMVELFVREIEQGVDGTAHRAGVIKVAGGRDRLTDRQRLTFRAAAEAQRRTGCPILTHTEQGTAALEQIAVLREAGADLRHVVLSHTDRQPDRHYHRDILQSGVNVEYDSAFRWKPVQSNPTLELLKQLVPEFPDQIMLGMDAARTLYWKSYGGQPGLTYLLAEFTERMKQAGLNDDFLRRIFVTTPAESYKFIDL